MSPQQLDNDGDVRSIVSILRSHERDSWPVACLIAQLSGQSIPARPRLYTAVEMYTDVIALLKPYGDREPAVRVLIECMEQELAACWLPSGMGGHA